MKRFIYLMVIVVSAFVFNSCDKDTDKDKIIVGAGFPGVISSDGGTLVLRFTTHYDWLIASKDNWILFDPAIGVAGESMVTITVSEYLGATNREAVITIYMGEVSKEIIIEQYADTSIEIPDVNFKEYLTTANIFTRNSSVVPDSEDIDVVLEALEDAWVDSGNLIDFNGDGKISTLEAKEIRYINVSADSVLSLAGIEHMPNLEFLKSVGTSGVDNAVTGKLSSLDLSGNPALKYLQCDFNQITSLDVSAQINLESFLCLSNEISVIDVSTLVNLTIFMCSSNQLQVLDVRKNVNLVHLVCEPMNDMNGDNILKKLYLNSAHDTAFMKIPTETIVIYGEGEDEVLSVE